MYIYTLCASVGMVPISPTKPIHPSTRLTCPILPQGHRPLPLAWLEAQTASVPDGRNRHHVTSINPHHPSKCLWYHAAAAVVLVAVFIILFIVWRYMYCRSTATGSTPYTRTCTDTFDPQIICNMYTCTIRYRAGATCVVAQL